MAMLATIDDLQPSSSRIEGQGLVGTPLASSDQLRRLHVAVMSVGSDLDLATVLHRVVEAAVELVDARYGAIGVLDDDQSLLDDSITTGLEPRVAFPGGHPTMTTFLEVPVLVGGEAYGNLYLTDKRNDEPFTDIDEELTIALAAAAGLGIEKARLHTRLRRSDVVEDRDRIARDLHDTVVQNLFATGFTLQSALGFTGTDPEVTRRIEQAIDGLDHVINEVRATVFELHAAVGADGGIRAKLLQLGDELTDALGFRPSFEFEGPVDATVAGGVAAHLLAVVGEALANVARHARAVTASVLIKVEGRSLCALVDDDGVGPRSVRIGGHGLTNLAHRAEQLGGTCTLEQHPEGGSRLRWQVTL